MPEQPPRQPPPPGRAPAEPAAEVSAADLRRRDRRAFAVWAAAGLAGLGSWWWLRTRPASDDLPWPLRQAHRFNERLGREIFSPTHLAPEFPPGEAGEPKVNGKYGRPAAGTAAQPVRVEQPGHPPRWFEPAEVVAGLPRVEITTELKCIEGWSQVVTWGGVRFADFAEKLGTAPVRHPYVALSTRDGEYYVGLDTASAMHPQTLLCDRMNGVLLPTDHGGPLRMVIVVKYGIKNIKWLARVRFQDDRPPDYWADRGYDWYAGL